MSRIDEALARARNLKPEDVTPPPQVEVDENVQFAEASSVTETPSQSEPSEVAEPEIDKSVIDPDDNDFRSLPQAEKLAVSSADGTSTEQYRRLAGRLYLAQAEHGTRVVMITSAMPGEGKTLTASNLALTLSESYKRQVLLIDADLRRPWIHEMFQVPNVSGLNDGLRSEEERKVPLLRLTDHLSVLTAGRPDRDPMSILSSERMQRVLQEASARFDWVIIDTPPVALLTDAHLLASLVDAVLLVIRAGQTPLPAINTAVQAVGRERILGVVLNRADDALVYHTYQYYGAYGGHQVTAGKPVD
jgi:capsular exopolysaccharide synthesis family protein